ncbi:helix-turn-helix domain-containing protein [Streptomyces sp. AMCC400023]|uniref:helix-turn-helix domain-containing protein n=1 Tax=Streptomyces sp. AMCC400023 TaxID=2056258 RepID=UPI001F3AF74F|nr:helix-turn-helix transcriptional regulator [Streptomyces sp. AMCC400023]UJV41589.1 hypothetical protein CVT30_18560 [Streptomyces sp. AMCC400023]
MPSYRLHIGRLQEAAAALGDHTNYAIAKRTGLNQTTLSRVCRGLVKPAAETLLTLATAYGLSVDELIQQDAEPEAEDSAA